MPRRFSAPARRISGFDQTFASSEAERRRLRRHEHRSTPQAMPNPKIGGRRFCLGNGDGFPNNLSR